MESKSLVERFLAIYDDLVAESEPAREVAQVEKERSSGTVKAVH
jgi:hypothetical protein